MNREITCISVPGGWQTAYKDTGELFGPAFHSIQKLWQWQRDNCYGDNP